MEWVAIASMCAKVHTLPNPGGLFQQDPSHVRKLELVYETQANINKEEEQNLESKRRLKSA